MQQSMQVTQFDRMVCGIKDVTYSHCGLARAWVAMQRASRPQKGSIGSLRTVNEVSDKMESARALHSATELPDRTWCDTSRSELRRCGSVAPRTAFRSSIDDTYPIANSAFPAQHDETSSWVQMTRVFNVLECCFGKYAARICNAFLVIH
ncbi:hypothetical protein BD309DRAFT_954348 [Dichomitus squalens]|uniref:Uncharacterized protein n=1 Tax=Dichomitus squalens TaxID=114155 RepID=A0A4Q9NX03_9APHY|nr:hypothetical protein BD311DRAFT_758196 [Dichomitus squalens]TBU46369.1 hypothetical protein BD309DRAFT_954348 [Dichomitus squalens]